MVICIFLKFRMVNVFETLQTLLTVKMNIFQMKISNEITLLLILICSFIKFKVFISLPTSFHGPLSYKNALQSVNWLCHWSQFNWVKQTDNTVSVQWGFTVYIYMPLMSRSQRTTLNNRRPLANMATWRYDVMLPRSNQRKVWQTNRQTEPCIFMHLIHYLTLMDFCH